MKLAREPAVQAGESDAVLHLEQQLLSGEPADAEMMERLTTAEIVSSPLLCQLYGERSVWNGDLRGGLDWLSAAVKGLAAQGLQRHLLEALADLAVVHLKTGNLSEARTILLFLREELRRSEPVSGRIPHALAKGGFLLDDGGNPGDYVRLAFEQYAEEARFVPLGTFLLDVWTGILPREELARWDAQVVRARHLANLEQAPSAFLQMLDGLNHYYAGRWADAAATFDRLNASALRYDHAALSRFFRFFAINRTAQPESPDEQDCGELENMQGAGEVDLELRFYREIAAFARNLNLSDASAAFAARQRAEHLHRLAPFPYQARLLASIGDRNPARKPRPWRVHCFGNLRFVGDGREVAKFSWKRRKTQELLIYLLLQPRYAAARDKTTELLFGEGDADKMANRLYVTVHELKRMAAALLGLPDFVSIREGVIRLNEQYIEHVDVEQFTALCRVGEQLWRHDRETAAELFEQACQLFDEIVPELGDAEWLDGYREAMAEKQAGMLKRLSLKAAADGHQDLAESYIGEWLRIRPLQEEAHMAMIQLLINDGRRAEALRWYRKWEQLCRRELGTSPMPETRRLVMEDAER